MSSSDRRTVLRLLGVLPLAACGFVPAFGTNGPATKLLGRVRADDPKDKLGFDFITEIETRLGRPSSPAYALSYTIVTNNVGVVITTSNVINRYQITGAIDFKLTEIGTGKVLASGHVDNFTSYSAAGSTVATLSAKDDANTRLMTMLADDVVARLIAAAGAFAK